MEHAGSFGTSIYDGVTTPRNNHVFKDSFQFQFYCISTLHVLIALVTDSAVQFLFNMCTMDKPYISSLFIMANIIKIGEGIYASRLKLRERNICPILGFWRQELRQGKRLFIMANIINRTLDEENRIFPNKRISEEYVLIQIQNS